jgi:hypothetical protein
METKKEKILEKAFNGEWITSEEIKEFADKNSETLSGKKYNNNKNLPNGKQLAQKINRNLRNLKP